MIAATLARRAFRRPVGADDVARLMPFYDTGRKSGSFDTGIEQLVTAVLASPDFLYRAIDPPAGALAAKSSATAGAQSGVVSAATTATSTTFALDDLALASRLSFFLWNQGPDDQLLALAERGALHEPRALDAQVDRMLADPRAATLVTSFALKWLNVDDLTAVVPDAQIFPEFSDALRTDFASEIELFLKSVLLDNHDVRELLTSDQTFLNERLARHYGVTGVHGPQFRRVKLDDPRASAARQGRRIAAHVVRRPHVARAARRVGARQAHGHTADAAAAERRRRPHAEGRRETEDAARAARAAIAPTQSAAAATASSIPTASRSRTSP